MTNTERTEVDMGYVQGFVNLIAQALVAATELPKQIEAMQADLTTLHGDLDRTKQRNIELDTITGDLRRQRDEAEQALSQAKSDYTKSQSDLGLVNQDNEHLRNRNAELETQRDQYKRERDDYGLKHMAAEDRANEAEKTLKEMRKLIGMPEPQPEAKPETPQPVAQALQAPPTPEPPKPTEPKRIYEGELDYWEKAQGKAERFDSDKHRYYIEE